MMMMTAFAEFDEDPHSNSSSEMDEYESEEELGDTPGSKTSLRHKPAAPRSSAKENSSGSKHNGGGERGGKGRGPMDMKDYIEAMDFELSKTTIGKSFVRVGDEEKVCDASELF